MFASTNKVLQRYFLRVLRTKIPKTRNSNHISYKKFGTVALLATTGLYSTCESVDNYKVLDQLESCGRFIR